MFEQIKIQRLSMSSIYKLLAVGTTFSLVPFSTLMGVLSLFGAQTITWDGKHLIGYDGLIASPFIGLFLSAFITSSWAPCAVSACGCIRCGVRCR
jgi:hypothetical protein